MTLDEAIELLTQRLRGSHYISIDFKNEGWSGEVCYSIGEYERIQIRTEPHSTITEAVTDLIERVEFQNKILEESILKKMRGEITNDT